MSMKHTVDLLGNPLVHFVVVQ
uniref:Uncharacterized protein n=1 Tax=Arundo donax TaxID=35708 RepID=A0A0A9FV16_ARUDO